MTDSSTALPEVRCLLCHAHVPMALDCLGSMRRASVEPFRLVLHDDGTLTDHDREQLGQTLSPAAIISRSEADERMATILANRPQARAYRQRQIYALKLFDLPLLGDAPRFTIIDSDILFLRRCTGLFTWDSPLRFMVDSVNAYSLRPWQIRNFPLPSRINVGITQIERRVYDSDYLEWFVGEQRLHAIAGWIEQTAWAALGQRHGCTVIDSSQVRLMHRSVRENDPAVALHFVTPQRARLATFVARSQLTLLEAPTHLTSRAPGPCRASTMMVERVSHGINARLLKRH